MTSTEPARPTSTEATSTEPTPPTNPGDAFRAALTTEYGVIYGYGMVSAYSPPDLNSLVADAIHQHRDRRDRVVAMLSARSITAPVAAAGYRLPIAVNNAADAAQLAVRMENSTAVAWRAVVEQADDAADREFAAAALTESAVLAARWNQAVGAWPLSRAFPGGND